jgi:hypothetical protein
MHRRHQAEAASRYALVRVAAAVVLGLVAIGWGAPRAASASFFFESGFDEDVFGWGPLNTFSQISWSDLDIDGSVESGSARIEVNADTPPLVGFPHDYRLECFSVDPGLTYQVGGWILIPTGQDTEGSAQMSVLFYPNASCSSVPELRNTFALRTPGTWTWVEDPEVVPATTAGSARVGMAVFKNSADVTFEAHFDDVLFAPEPSSAILHAAVLAALAALAWARQSARAPSRAAPPCSAKDPAQILS